MRWTSSNVRNDQKWAPVFAPYQLKIRGRFSVCRSAIVCGFDRAQFIALFNILFCAARDFCRILGKIASYFVIECFGSSFSG